MQTPAMPTFRRSHEETSNRADQWSHRIDYPWSCSLFNLQVPLLRADLVDSESGDPTPMLSDSPLTVGGSTNDEDDGSEVDSSAYAPFIRGIYKGRNVGRDTPNNGLYGFLVCEDAEYYIRGTVLSSFVHKFGPLRAGMWIGAKATLNHVTGRRSAMHLSRCK